MSNLIFHSRNRFKSFRNTVKVVSESDFPYQDAELALKLIRDQCDAVAEILESGETWMSENVQKCECGKALLLIIRYLPLVGFILRATNTRNAFEIVRPIRCLARKILEPNTDGTLKTTKLVISSEWEYSPYVFFDVRELPDFVLIGFPAHESSNPLLIPLSGHELGHPLWRKSNMLNQYKPNIEIIAIKKINERWGEFTQIFPSINLKNANEIKNDMFAMQIIGQIVSWAAAQLEEIFSDAVAIRIFGTSFLKAFHYLLSPGISESRRNPSYPTLSDRVRIMNRIATTMGFSQVSEIEENFEIKKTLHLAEKDIFCLSIADSISSELISDIVTSTENSLQHANLPVIREDADDVKNICISFSQGIPFDNPNSLQEILCAAWITYERNDLWQNEPLLLKNRDRVLRDLILKTIEIYDINLILEGSQC